MKVHYACQPIEKSIFLAGPTPRDENVISWRPDALKLLEQLMFTGTVYIPENDAWGFSSEYDDQVHWEWEALNAATVVVFWVPRHLETMPAFTTNVEFGALITSGKVLYGRPSWAAKVSYLDALAQRNRLFIYDDLKDLLLAAINQTKGQFGYV